MPQESYIWAPTANPSVSPGPSASQLWAADTLVTFNSPETRDWWLANGGAYALDKFKVDLAAGGYNKTAGIALVFTGSTPITLNLTSLAAATGVSALGSTAGVADTGTPSFATLNAIIFNNVGGEPIVVSPGASDPLGFPILGGTSPTLTLDAGDESAHISSAGVTVNSSACNITFTPTSGGTLLIGFGGA
jgi:hypothetical protein